MSFSPNFRGDSAKVATRQLGSGYQNGAGMDLPALTPVAINLSGQLTLVDLTDANAVSRFVGLTIDNPLPSGAIGTVADGGRIELITTSFSVGDVLYANKIGSLTKNPPVAGSENFLTGDYVILVGIVVANQFDNTKKDLHLSLSVVGQLG